MNLITHIKSINKTTLFIYLFSYPVFILLNNLIYNLIGLSFGYHFHFYYFGKTCRFHNVDAETIIWFCSLFLLKIILFYLLFRLIKSSKSKATAVLKEILLSFFLFEFAYVLASLTDLLKITPYATWCFFSNPILMSDKLLNFPSVIFSIIWVLILAIVLYKNRSLHFWFLFKRLTIQFTSMILYAIFPYFNPIDKLFDNLSYLFSFF